MRHHRPPRRGSSDDAHDDKELRVPPRPAREKAEARNPFIEKQFDSL
jgi:hypothetical protein